MMEKKAESTEQKADSAYPTTERRNLGEDKGDLGQRRDSLARRLRSGDRTAAVELVDIYYEQIYLYMRRLGHDRQISEDLTQDSFLNAWHHIGQLRDGKALSSWLYRIAGNMSRLYWRKHRHKEIVGIDSADMPAIGRTERDAIERYEQLEQLRIAVSRLPAKLRQSIVLHYMQQLTISEAAHAAGVRPGTFKSRLNRALRALRKHVT